MLRPLHLGAWHTTKWTYKSHLSIRVLHGSKMNMVCGISVSLLLLWLRLDSCIVFTYIQVTPLLVSKASTWKSSDESYTWSPIVFHAFSVDHPNNRKTSISAKPHDNYHKAKTFQAHFKSCDSSCSKDHYQSSFFVSFTQWSNPKQNQGFLSSWNNAIFKITMVPYQPSTSTTPASAHLICGSPLKINSSLEVRKNQWLK